MQKHINDSSSLNRSAEMSDEEKSFSGRLFDRERVSVEV